MSNTRYEMFQGQRAEGRRITQLTDLYARMLSAKEGERFAIATPTETRIFVVEHIDSHA